MQQQEPQQPGQKQTEESLIVQVKCPFYHDEKAKSHALSFEAQDTINCLKQRLEREHPARPKAKDQRLVYKGRILKGEEVAREVLEPNRDLYLVLRNPSTENLEAENESKEAQNFELIEQDKNTVPSNHTDLPTNETLPILSSATNIYPLIGFLAPNGDVFFVNEFSLDRYQSILKLPSEKAKLLSNPTALPAQPSVSPVAGIKIRIHIPIQWFLMATKLILAFIVLSKKMSLPRKIMLACSLFIVFLYYTGAIAFPTALSTPFSTPVAGPEAVPNRRENKIVLIVKEVANFVFPLFTSLFPPAMGEQNAPPVPQGVNQ